MSREFESTHSDASILSPEFVEKSPYLRGGEHDVEEFRNVGGAFTSATLRVFV